MSSIPVEIIMRDNLDMNSTAKRSNLRFGEKSGRAKALISSLWSDYCPFLKVIVSQNSVVINVTELYLIYRSTRLN
jgi:hypothetical protein